MTSHILFEPLQLGAIEIANRIVMAPMTRNRADNTVPGPMNAEYYRQRASAGLIIAEATQVSEQGVGYPNTPGIHSHEQIAGWQLVTDAVHAQGGKIFLQLFHAGRISHPSLQPGNAPPVAPSAIRPAGEAFTFEGLQPFVTPHALETHEIRAIVEAFAAAARNAMTAGFDGVEIHAANGYLIDQFLRTSSNSRGDRYGGAAENRVRLLAEITDAVTAQAGTSRTGVRLSPCGSFNDMHDDDPAETFALVADELGKRGLAYLHVVEALEDSGVFDFDRLARAFGGLYMANEGYDENDARRRIRNARVDLISFGKLFVSNPDLPARLLSDAPLAYADPASFYGGGAQGYIDYPALADQAT